MRRKKHFYPFLNYHIRTNAFMISAELMRKIKHKALTTKLDAWRFESGKESMTQQVLHMNLRAVLVGKDGKVFEKKTCVKSGTLWQADQYDLLIADNRTNAYAKADLAQRWRLSTYAWADRANPLPSGPDTDESRTGLALESGADDRRRSTGAP
jgi:hypothetical protein